MYHSASPTVVDGLLSWHQIFKIFQNPERERERGRRGGRERREFEENRDICIVTWRINVVGDILGEIERPSKVRRDWIGLREKGDERRGVERRGD